MPLIPITLCRDLRTWPGNQLDLIDQLANRGKKNLIIIQMGGGQVNESTLLSNLNISAIL
jgi:beta-D-xylosidase 4